MEVDILFGYLAAWGEPGVGHLLFRNVVRRGWCATSAGGRALLRSILRNRRQRRHNRHRTGFFLFSHSFSFSRCRIEHALDRNLALEVMLWIINTWLFFPSSAFVELRKALVKGFKTKHVEAVRCRNITDAQSISCMQLESLVWSLRSVLIMT